LASDEGSRRTREAESILRSSSAHPQFFAPWDGSSKMRLIRLFFFPNRPGPVIKVLTWATTTSAHMLRDGVRSTGRSRAMPGVKSGRRGQRGCVGALGVAGASSPGDSAVSRSCCFGAGGFPAFPRVSLSGWAGRHAALVWCSQVASRCGPPPPASLVPGVTDLGPSRMAHLRPPRAAIIGSAVFSAALGV